MKTAIVAAFAAFFCACVPAGAQDKPFVPGGATVTLSAGVASTAVQVQAGPYGGSLRVYNSGTVAAFLSCGGSGIVATTATGMPIAPGSVEILGGSQTHCAGITASGTATVYLTAGSGI